MRPRIGVSSIAIDATAWADWCRAVEAASLDEISVADHLKPGLLPPLTALAAAAAVTERVALSTLGLPLPPPADRIARLEESVAALRPLLAGETVTTSGPSLRLTGLTITSSSPSTVPLLVGGGARGVHRLRLTVGARPSASPRAGATRSRSGSMSCSSARSSSSGPWSRSPSSSTSARLGSASRLGPCSPVARSTPSRARSPPCAAPSTADSGRHRPGR